ncbi:Aat Leu/Phe-tRNA-protein transferase [Acidimicrobiia bacterium]
MPDVPIEPEPTDWELPHPASADENGLVGVGADLLPGTLLLAYRSGLFPMPLSGHSPIGWWSPDPRGVIRLDRLRLTRSLRRSLSRYEVRIDTAFEQVMSKCASPDRDGGWITDEIHEAYTELHRLGWAHSVEAWNIESGELVGGLYGVNINGLFAGESMFHREPDASKVALVGLVGELQRIGAVLLDIQWLTPHLQTLGAEEIPRRDYLQNLEIALSTGVKTFGESVSS